MWNCVFGQSLIELNKVKEIKLLETSRSDVRRIFSEYNLPLSDEPRHYEWFSTKNANINISYSSGNCSNTFEDWNVSEWQVKEITVFPTITVRLKDIGINLLNFKKEKVFVNRSDVYLYFDKDKGIAFEVNKNKIQTITFIPSKKNYSLLCENERVKNYYSSKKWSNSELKERIYIREYPNSPPDVIKLSLSSLEISSNERKLMTVSAIGKDLENDVLIYDYKVSGGKIIGQGTKVFWDLSGVKTGNYTITVSVDDGCGFCGKSITKTILVK